jgi:hypothetical protein
MTLDGQSRILRVHPLAVIFNAQQLFAAKLDRHGNAPGAGIERVLDKLLDDRRGTFDHFAGGDLIGEVQGKAVDAGHSELTIDDWGLTIYGLTIGDFRLTD